MKNILLMLIGLSTFTAFSKTSSWGVAELKRRFEVKGDIFILDTTGKKVIRKAGNHALFKTRDGKIESEWTSSGDHAYGIRHKWEVLDDGTVSVRIELYNKVIETKDRVGGPTLQNLVKKVDRVLENLEPITLTIWQDDTTRTIVRFVPDFEDGDSPKNISDIPISGTDVIITDNGGMVWANHITHEGKYCGFETARGTIFMSYYPFAGSKELGLASGNEIELNLGEKKVVTFRSQTPYLPQGVQAKVYGVYHSERKSSAFPKSGIMDRDEEPGFVDRIKTWPN